MANPLDVLWNGLSQVYANMAAQHAAAVQNKLVEHLGFTSTNKTGSLQQVGGTSAPSQILLTPLLLSSNTFLSSAAQGTQIGIITGFPPTAALTLKNSNNSAVQLHSTLIQIPGGFQIQWSLQVGLTPPGPSTFLVTVTQTDPSATNSPLDTIFTIVETLAPTATSALPLGIP